MFICLCGPASTGKSTLAKVLKKRYNGIVVSTDAIREELYGDASIQENPKKVFQIAYERIKKNLQIGKTVIFDAMCLTPKDRKRVLKVAKPWNRGFNVVFAATIPLPIAKERNSQRERKVPNDVIEKQFLRYVVPTLDEGWDVIERF